MRIAITNAFLPSEEQSGVPYQVHYLAEALVGNGHDVTVFSFSPKPAGATYAVHQFGRPKIANRYLPFIMAFCLAKTDFSSFDVVNVHGDNYLLRTKTPVVRTFHGAARDERRHAGTWRRRLFFSILIPLEWLGAKMADHIVGVSEATHASIPGVQTLIPCGVDLDAFHAGTKTDRPTVLFVGTEEGRKRGAWLADLFKKHVLPAVPSAELRMVSDYSATEPGVRRYGRVSSDELAELYRSAWLFCLPSTYEGFGVPYIEAMAANTAVIATAPNPGAEEVLARGSFGAFVNDQQLAETLISLLTNDMMRDALQQRGLERSRQYSWQTISAKYETTFRLAISSKVAV
jgi:phosphatidylinositol alpha-mannosyltransferase